MTTDPSLTKDELHTIQVAGLRSRISQLESEAAKLTEINRNLADRNELVEKKASGLMTEDARLTSINVHLNQLVDKRDAEAASLRAEIASLRASLAEKDEALRPFAREAQGLEMMADEDSAMPKWLLIGDYRRASRVMGK